MESPSLTPAFRGKIHKQSGMFVTVRREMFSFSQAATIQAYGIQTKLICNGSTGQTNKHRNMIRVLMCMYTNIGANWDGPESD